MPEIEDCKSESCMSGKEKFKGNWMISSGQCFREIGKK